MFFTDDAQPLNNPLGRIAAKSEISEQRRPCQLLFKDTSPFTPVSGLVGFLSGFVSTTKARAYGSLLI